MSRIKLAKVAGLKIADLVKKLKKRKYAKDSKKNVERARGVKTNKSVKAYNIRAKDAETKIIPVKRQSQKGSSFQTHRVRSKMGRAAAQSEERGKLPSPLPTLERLFKRDVQGGKLDDYRLTKRYLKNKLSDVAKKKFKGGMMKRKMLTGGQAKLDKNKNNKIDAEDFAMLRKEKSKKKPMKAALGAIALGAMTAAKLKKLKGKKTKMPGAAGVMGSGLIPGMSVADIIQKKLKRSKGGGADTGKVGEQRSKVSVSIDRIQRLARKMKDKDRLTQKDIELAGDLVGSVSPNIKGKKSAVDLIKRSIDNLKSSKKMGGGMMRQYTKGGGADYNRPKSADDIIQAAVRDKGKAQGRRRPSMKGPVGRLAAEAPTRKQRTLMDVKGKMGGGMMMKPMGYKAGKSVKVKCKIGRNKPTKMY